jgi:hypothetical protein
VPSAFLVHIPARLSRQIIERMERREWLRQQIAGLRGGIKRALNQWKAAVSALKPLRVVGARWMNATMFAYFRYWTSEYRTRMQAQIFGRAAATAEPLLLPSSSPLPPLSCSSPRFHRPPHLLLSKSSTRPPHPPPSSISLSIHASSLPPPPDTHPGPPPPPPSAATDGHRPFRPRRRRTRAEQVEGSARDILQDAEGGRCAHEA